MSVAPFSACGRRDAGGPSRVALGLAIVLLHSGVISGCGSSSTPSDVVEQPPRLVLLYAPCTVNADFLSPYGASPSVTPRLDAFSREAVIFERHMTESGQSGPAYASIFTGVHADRHGVFLHPTPLAGDVTTIGEVFRDGGFDVGAWLAHVMASGELGYGRGARRISDLMLTADSAGFVELLERLRREPSARALVVAHHTLTHSPYRTESLVPFCARVPEACGPAVDDPERFQAAAGFYLNHHSELSHDFPDVVERFDLGRQQIDYLAQVIELLYRANVARLDHHFGTLLDVIDASGLAGESLVVFTADHGEAMYRDGLLFPWTHGHQLAPEVLRVPLLIRAPGLGPRRFGAVTRSVDLLPTLASWAGLTPPANLPGHDLAAAVRGDGPLPELDAFSHTALTAEVVLEESKSWRRFRTWFPREDPELMWMQVRRGDDVVQLRGSLVSKGDGGDVELVPARFDLAADPAQATNLWRDEDPEARARRTDLETYRRRLIDAWRGLEDGAREGALDEERQKELLRRLGYIE